MPDKLRKNIMLIGDKRSSGTTFADAEELARYERLRPNTVGFHDFVEGQSYEKGRRLVAVRALSQSIRRG